VIAVPFKNHCKEVVPATGATLDLIAMVALDPHSIVDAPVVTVDTVATAGAAFIVTTVALLDGLEHPPTCVAFTV
jgi:hypothetical protein